MVHVQHRFFVVAKVAEEAARYILGWDSAFPLLLLKRRGLPRGVSRDAGDRAGGECGSGDGVRRATAA